MRREISSLDIRPADLDQFGGFPAITAEQRHSDAKLPGLFGHQSDIRVIASDQDGVRIGGFDSGELAFKILVPAVIDLLGDDLAAAPHEGSLEIACQTDAV